MLDDIRRDDGEIRLKQFLSKFQNLYTQEMLRFFPVSSLDSAGFLVASESTVDHAIRHDFDFSDFTPVAIPIKASALSIVVTIHPDETTTGYSYATVQTGPAAADRVIVASGYAQGESGQFISGGMTVPPYPDGTVGITPFWADSGDSNLVEVHLVGYWA